MFDALPKNSRRINDEINRVMNFSLKRNPLEFPSREETIRMCRKLGFYDAATANILSLGEVPPSKLTESQMDSLEKMPEEGDEDATP